MPPRGQSAEERAQQALERLNELGGAAHLPEVVNGDDVIPILGVQWYKDMRRLGSLPGLLPGLQGFPGVLWRCERSTFLAWLKLTAGEMPPPLSDDLYE